MKTVDEATEGGVVRRRFDLTVEGRVVPGLQWSPEGEAVPRPTVLVGHGGFQSKEAPNIVALAIRLARRGYVTIALDAPGHGDRRTDEQARRQEDVLRRLRTGGLDDELRRARERIAAGAGAGGSDSASPGGDGRQPRMVREWQALLDELGSQPEPIASSYGYWGVSMGCRYGIPLLAAEPRIAAAVLGLFGLVPGPAFEQSAASITVPLLFLVQYHDELVTPESALALWAAFGSAEKTLHVNPGPHVGVPRFELDASAAFYGRHLG